MAWMYSSPYAYPWDVEGNFWGHCFWLSSALKYHNERIWLSWQKK